MENHITKWLKDPVYFRYGFLMIVMLCLFLHYVSYGENYVYVFYILGTIFLGIGYYNRSFLTLVTVMSLGVFCRAWFTNELSIGSFIVLELVYTLILYISVSLMKLNQKIQKDNLELIFALSKALDSRDTYTSDHSQNVALYAKEIATRMNLSGSVIETIYKGGLLHDIGKIGIPEDILLKPGKLTDQEYGIIKTHPVIGYEMIKHVAEFKGNAVLDIVLYHHERFDGSGYPKGLKGKEIPLEASIIAIADTFDAMTSKRIYRNEMDIADVLIEIRNNRGLQFDPEVTDAFLGLFENDVEKSMVLEKLKKTLKLNRGISCDPTLYTLKEQKSQGQTG
jgi:HD-GYP domain-containing protein (c-di-GMP phosphodiesterase class II)